MHCDLEWESIIILNYVTRIHESIYTLRELCSVLYIHATRALLRERALYMMRIRPLEYRRCTIQYMHLSVSCTTSTYCIIILCMTWGAHVCKAVLKVPYRWHGSLSTTGGARLLHILYILRVCVKSNFWSTMSRVCCVLLFFEGIHNHFCDLTSYKHFCDLK